MFLYRVSKQNAIQEKEGTKHHPGRASCSQQQGRAVGQFISFSCEGFILLTLYIRQAMGETIAIHQSCSESLQALSEVLRTTMIEG